MSKGSLSIDLHGSIQSLLSQAVDAFYILYFYYKHHSSIVELEFFNFIDMGCIEGNVVSKALK